MTFTAFVLATVFATDGCVGYLMGWSSEEVMQQRRIIAELEARNATLVEESLRLRRQLERLRAGAVPGESVGEDGEPAASDRVEH